MWRYSAKILKESIDIYLFEIINIIITSFQNDSFLEELMVAKVFQYKKKDNLGEKNCRPVSSLSYTLLSFYNHSVFSGQRQYAYEITHFSFILCLQIA